MTHDQATPDDSVFCALCDPPHETSLAMLSTHLRVVHGWTDDQLAEIVDAALISVTAGGGETAAPRVLPAPELERLVKQHVADYWQEPGRDVNNTVALMVSFGINPPEMVKLAAVACDGPVSPHTKLGQTAIFMQGFLLGLDLARQLETGTLRIETEYWHETAVQYGRVLQALVARNGGTLELDQADMMNDKTMIVVEAEGDTIRVVLEPVPDEHGS